MQSKRVVAAVAFLMVFFSETCYAQPSELIVSGGSAAAADFPITTNGRATSIYVAPGNPQTVTLAVAAFAADVDQVTRSKPLVLRSLDGPLPSQLILIGVIGHSPEIDRLIATRKLDVSRVAGRWEAAVTAVVNAPMPGVKRALVIAGADRRGAAFALFTLSRQMGVSPWTWWADVPIRYRAAVFVRAGSHVQSSPSVQYRGIFLNDEDWGLRPWASKKMDPAVDDGKGNIGPHTYERIFELLLRLHANSLWPAMHPGSLPFNAVPENALLADKWGIVMGSSHSEALLRNNVGEWNEKTDGPWNYQKNADAMNAYWDKRLQENGKYENFYTVGLRGLHDSGLEATGTPEVKAKLVEDVMAEQRRLLASRVNQDVAKIPQIIWLYKESLDLYRAGMKVPDDVTLGWTDDNYGYIRELPNAVEQARTGGSGVYYHVSYWGAPHDYLWLCTTPPSLIQEEMTKAYDHNARTYWILNVGDLKPAEIDIDYFMQLATDEPRMAKMSQREFLTRWAAEQFPATASAAIANVMTGYYALNFIRKPEFMGFNGYNDEIKRTAFNPLAWSSTVQRSASSFARRPSVAKLYNQNPSENQARAKAWWALDSEVDGIASTLPTAYQSAYFELVSYPIHGSSAMNDKFLATDLTHLDAHIHADDAMAASAARAHAAYDAIQTLTTKYNSIKGGKWSGIMSDAPRNRPVFEMPRTATAADADSPLPASWGAGSDACQSGSAAAGTARSTGAYSFVEQHCAVSINAARFARSHDSASPSASGGWHVLRDLGISGDSVEYGSPGLLANGVPKALGSNDSAWLEYDFTTTAAGPATLTLYLLPTFAIDSDHRLSYAVALDGGSRTERDAAGGASTKAAATGDGPSGVDWPQNVLRNSAIDTIALGTLSPGRHTIRLIYRDPGVVFEHLLVSFPGAPPAYPVPPDTKQ
jgi:hypothetical protein